MKSHNKTLQQSITTLLVSAAISLQSCKLNSHENNMQREENLELSDTTGYNFLNTSVHNVSMRAQSKFNAGFNETIKKITEAAGEDEDQKRQNALASGIRYLTNWNSRSGSDVEKLKLYFREAEKIMDYLHSLFKDTRDHYHPWVKFITVTRKICWLYGIDNNACSKIFEKHLGSLIENPKIDWRILMNMKRSKILDKKFLDKIDNSLILNGLIKSIDKTLQSLLWYEDNNTTKFLEKTLENIRELANNKDSELVKSIISGRIHKKTFKMNKSDLASFPDQTIIVGEEGGMYMLFNSLDKEDSFVKDIITSQVDKNYLEEKIKETREKPEIEAKINENLEIIKNRKTDKVVIGKGGFGKVRFALNLLNGIVPAGQVICVKKTKSFKSLNQANENRIARSNIETVINSTLSDYLSYEFADIIYSPRVIDMSIIFGEDTISSDHRKGYLMMEVFPKNTADKIFKNPEYQTWEYQKPYFLGVCKSVQKLIEDGIAMTDLKPENILYDVNARKVTLIDLGGSINAEKEENLSSIKINTYFEYTDGFRAPELKEARNNQATIDLKKAMSYSCCKVLEKAMSSTDLDAISIRKLEEMRKSLINKDVDKRMSIPKALEIIDSIGDNSWRDRAIFTGYINKLGSTILHDRLLLGINEDIGLDNELKSKKDFFIPLKTTSLDPTRYKQLNTEDIEKTIKENFFDAKTGKQVFLLLASAGSGKSAYLQRKFIEAVKDWKMGVPLPIYFNLANGIASKDILKELDTKLGTNIADNLKGKEIHLYIDSFDEGFGIESKRETLIKEYLSYLGDKNVKIFITCRSEYLRSDDDEAWFIPESKSFEKAYIAPFGYQGSNIPGAGRDPVGSEEKERMREKQKEESDFLSKYVKEWCEIKNPEASEEQIKQIIERIDEHRLRKSIDTGFLFDIAMEVFSQEEDIKKDSISREDLYGLYVDVFINKAIGKIEKSSEGKGKIKALQRLFTNTHQKDLKENLKEVAKQLVKKMHIKGTFRVKSNDKDGNDKDGNDREIKVQSSDKDGNDREIFFEMLGFERSKKFDKQAFYHLLRCLPIKLERKNNTDSRFKLDQEISIGFVHDTIKNYFLLEKIKDELNEKDKFGKEKGESPTLASRDMVDDIEFMRFMAKNIEYEKDPKLTEQLRRVIDKTKKDKLMPSITSAANAITALVAAQYSFSQQDLSNVAIRGANLRNGLFIGTDFTDSDLVNVNMTNANLVQAKLDSTNLKNINLSILPDLIGHTDSIRAVSISPDCKYVVTGSRDKSAKIWEFPNGKLISTLEGNNDEINNISISPNSKYVVSGGSKFIPWENEFVEAKIWELTRGNLLATLGGHTGWINALAISPDEKYVVTGSSDNTAKIWELTRGNLLATLEGHTGWITALSISPNGKHVITGSHDNIAKIWELSSGNWLADLKGHTGSIDALSISPNGKHVITGSDDHTAKIWELKSREMISDLKGHTQAVTAVAISSDGKYIVTGSNDDIAKIWELSSGNWLADLKGHTQGINVLAISPSSKYVITGSEDNTLKIWDLINREQVSSLVGHKKEIKTLAISPDEKYVVSGSGDHTAKIWDLSIEKFVYPLVGHKAILTNNSICLSSDGRYMVSTSKDKTVKIWEMPKARLVKTILDYENELYALAISNDNKYVVTYTSFHAKIEVRNIITGEVIEKVYFKHISSDGFHHQDLSRNGKYMVLGEKDRKAKIWEIKDHMQSTMTKLQGEVGLITALCIAPNGKYAAIGTSRIGLGNDPTNVVILDLVTGKQLKELFESKNRSTINDIAVSLDSKYIAIGLSNNNTNIFSLTNNGVVRNLEGHSKAVNSIAISHYSNYVVTGSSDSTAKIWELTTGKLLFTLEGHSDGISTLAITSDEIYIITGSRDGEIKIWKLTNGKFVSNLKGHTSNISNLIITHNNEYLVTGSFDKTVKIWKIPSGTLVRELAGSESPLTADGATLENVKNLSESYQRVLKQRGATVGSVVEENDDKYDNYASDMKDYRKKQLTRLQAELSDLIGEKSNNPVKKNEFGSCLPSDKEKSRGENDNLNSSSNLIRSEMQEYVHNVNDDIEESFCKKLRNNICKCFRSSGDES